MEHRIAELEDALADLVAKRCFSAISGAGVEFAFILHLGDRQRRSLRLANPRLSFLQRTFEGSHTLLVECTWRVDGPEGVIASCLDEAKPAGPRDAALEELADRVVERVEVAAPGLDLTVRFEGGYTLLCFCTEVDEKQKRSNWTYAWPGGLATVGPRSRLLLETVAEREAKLGRLVELPPEEEIVEVWQHRLHRDDPEED